jgi:N-carbamoylputrescine amidase
MANDILRVAAVQQVAQPQAEANLANSIEGIAEARRRGAQLVLLQELHNGYYFCQSEDTRCFDLAEPIPGPTTERLAGAAKEHDVVLVASLFERRTGGVYHNTAVVFDRNGDVAGCYRKMHIPDDPGYYEKFYFTPGDQGFEPVDTSLGRLGVLVCWDQWFPEAARLMALAGAELLLYPTAIGWEPSDAADEQQRQYEAWQTVQRAHAVANGIPVVVCNRSGFEPAPDDHGGIQFWGNSFIAGPQGEILAQAGSEGSEVLVADIDRQRVEQVRRIWPFFRDRRIDAYQDLLRRVRD